MDCVEIFMQASRPHSSIIYSRSSTEGSDTFNDHVTIPQFPEVPDVY